MVVRMREEFKRMPQEESEIIPIPPNAYPSTIEAFQCSDRASNPFQESGGDPWAKSSHRASPTTMTAPPMPATWRHECPSSDIVRQTYNDITSDFEEALKSIGKKKGDPEEQKIDAPIVFSAKDILNFNQ